MKTNKILLLLTVITTCLFTGCSEQENVQFDAVNGQTLINFVGSSAALPVKAIETSSISINVELTTASDSDRVAAIVIDPSSTANAGQYSITDFVIPAGQHVGSATLTGNFDQLPDLGGVDVVLKLTGVTSEDVVERDTFTVTLERFCPLVIEDFYGTFTQVSGFDGAAPTPNPDATITAGPAANTLLISDLNNTGRGAVIELDYSDIANAKVIHRSEEFLEVFSVQGLGPVYTAVRFAADEPSNTFSTCKTEIKLLFYRQLPVPDTRFYGGSYEVILTKN
jgi:hypothetical protein